MPTEIKIPAVGESITEVQISEWLKSEGDSVKQDEPIAVIDSEKTTFDLPATHAGKLTRILHKAGETVAQSTGTVKWDGTSETLSARIDLRTVAPGQYTLAVRNGTS